MHPKTSRTAPIKCRRYPTPLTGSPNRTETAAHTRVHDHYICAVLPEKAHPLRTTAATIAVI
jgi:hypothetical protein